MVRRRLLIPGLCLFALLLPEPRAAAADPILPCLHDDALARAAAELLLSPGAPSPGALTEAARAAGSDAPILHSLSIRPGGSGRRVHRWLRRLAERSDAPLACAEAQGEAGGLVLATASGGRLRLDPRSRTLRGSLAPGFRRPEVVVRTDGELLRFGVTVAQLGAGVPLPSEVEEPALVQLVATGPAGPRPVAERFLGVPSTPGAGGDDLDGRLSDLRRRAGVLPLRSNRLLSEEASEHAARVCRQGRVAHVLAPGADPEVRLRARGLEARLVGEVVARATSVAGAMDALVRSPSHQLTLQERRFTDGGVGVAADARGRTCVVVLLAAWPRYAGH